MLLLYKNIYLSQQSTFIYLSELTPPTLAIIDDEPTPAFLTVVGINSDIHIHSIAKEEDTQKLNR